MGEGAATAVLKTLDRACQDGDRIYAVIKATAINNDGRTASLAAPNPEAQREVMSTALRKAGVRPEDVAYIAVNGSGSEVTDLLELKAIESVFRSRTRTPCELGSMKPNIGHPLCAEGIASFTKVVLMLHHRQKVPFLSAEEPMTHYDLAASPFHFSRSLTAWEGSPLLAAVNCFADGGTNAHIILQGWERDHSPESVRQPLPPPVFRRIDLSSPASGFEEDFTGLALPPAEEPEREADVSMPVTLLNGICGSGFWRRVAATPESVL